MAARSISKRRRRGRPLASIAGAKAAVAKILALRLRLGWSESQLARAAGVSQPALNRALNAFEPRWTPSLLAIHSYVENRDLGEDAAPTERRKILSQRLVQAMHNAWDGSPSDEDRIVRLLTLAEEFKQTTAQQKSKG